MYVRKFGEGLEHLKNKLLEMSSLVETGIQRSIDALVHKDRGEARINAIELEIDGLAIDLLALHQPMATNLRFIITALKINTNLERMGDLSLKIAHSARSLIDAPAITPIVDIPQIASLVQSMVRKSLDAFVARDVDLARNVLASDDAVDRLRTVCDQQLVGSMEENSVNIGPALRLLDVTRTLERLADHATNIAESVVFYAKGIDVRHHLEGIESAEPR